jgi:osmotically inducible lipoprotein OsmB
LVEQHVMPAAPHWRRIPRQAEVPFSIKESIMNMIKKLAASVAAIAMVLSLGACANMSKQNQNTAVGAGVGAVAGAVLTGGSAVGTVGGAAVGGVIGNQVKH